MTKKFSAIFLCCMMVMGLSACRGRVPTEGQDSNDPTIDLPEEDPITFAYETFDNFADFKAYFAPIAEEYGVQLVTLDFTDVPNYYWTEYRVDGFSMEKATGKILPWKLEDLTFSFHMYRYYSDAVPYSHLHIIQGYTYPITINESIKVDELYISYDDYLHDRSEGYGHPYKDCTLFRGETMIADMSCSVMWEEDIDKIENAFNDIEPHLVII